MAHEPLSRLKPPDQLDTVHDVGEPTDIVAATPGEKPRLEWTVTDLDLKSAPHTEVFLPGLWKRMHDDGTFKMFFHEGPDMTFWQFVAALSLPTERVQIVVGHDTDGTAKEHAGLLLLNHLCLTGKVKRAVGNFLFFREYWNRHDTADLARAVFNHWYGVMDFDVIVGITPRQNKAAIQFIKRIGFQIVGDVPMFTSYEGEPSASAISYMTRAQWRKRYHPDQPVEEDRPVTSE